MPVTQTDIDNLNAAIASGVKSAQVNNKRVEYRSIDSLILARNAMQEELNNQAATPRSRIVYHTQKGRGL